MPDEKLELLTVDKLLMAEVRTFEKMSGYTVEQLFQMGDDDGMPASVVMALAYVTEKRVRPAIKREMYEKMSYLGLREHMEAQFTFEKADTAPDDVDAEDPTKPA